MQRETAKKILRDMLQAMASEVLASFDRGEFHGQVIWIGGTSRALGLRIPRRFRQDTEIIANNAAWRTTPSPTRVISGDELIPARFRKT